MNPANILVVLFSFAIIQFAAWEPISLIAGGDDMTQEQIDYLTEQWGLDQPIHIQMWRYCTKMLRFDLGISYRQARPVLDIILGASALYPTAFNPFAVDRHSDWRICRCILCDAHAQYRGQQS